MFIQLNGISSSKKSKLNNFLICYNIFSNYFKNSFIRVYSRLFRQIE